MINLLSGMLVAGYSVAALFFLKFWTTSRDRLFALFSAAFFLLALQRLLLALTRVYLEQQYGLYTLRLIAFLLIIFAIVDKNRE